MKKFLGILVLGLLWCSSVYAVKGDGICGLQSHLADMSDSSISIKIAAFVKIKDTDKDNCKKIINILSDAKKGNNKFEGYIKNIMVEAKFKSDVEVKVNDLRLTWMSECGRANWGFEAVNDICAEMKPYKLYLYANYGTNTVSKNLFDKNLDNDSAFNELINLLN